MRKNKKKKELFHEKCATVNEKKLTAMNEYRQARRREKEQLDNHNCFNQN
jgi:hypothetical protein